MSEPVVTAEAAGISREEAKQMVGPGWGYLLDVLYAVTAGPVPVVVTTVKEKFGTLRVYYDGGDRNFMDLVDALENVSAHLCDQCGKQAGRRPYGGWILTRCGDCAPKTGDARNA